MCAQFRTARKLLRLGALTTLLAFAESAAAAQSMCDEIREGESASAVARRLTGDPHSYGRPWFQILNPSTGASIDKGAYHHVQAGWVACIAAQPYQPTPSMDPFVVLIGIVAFAATCIWKSADEYLARREVTVDAMKRFADDFVKEFERPLTQPGFAERPIKSRVKPRPGQKRLDILLAPASGRRYPNLADHYANVVYDVGRVTQHLRVATFVCMPPYAEGGWVVVPFNVIESQEQAGGS
jgi:hypothetical protein